MVNPFELLDARLAAIEDLLLDMKRADRTTPAAAPPPARILTINEAAEFVGLPKATLYKLTSARQIPHTKRGKKLYFEREALEAWLSEYELLLKHYDKSSDKDDSIALNS